VTRLIPGGNLVASSTSTVDSAPPGRHSVAAAVKRTAAVTLAAPRGRSRRGGRYRARMSWRPVVLGALVLAACGSEAADDETTTRATAPTTTAAAEGAITPDAAETTVPGPLAFRAPLVGGGTFDGTLFRGPAFVWFWAPY
jgi:hypothetical protein